MTEVPRFYQLLHNLLDTMKDLIIALLMFWIVDFLCQLVIVNCFGFSREAIDELRSAVQAACLSPGRLMVRDLKLSVHPRIVLISDGAPSAMYLSTESRCSLGRDSLLQLGLAMAAVAVAIAFGARLTFVGVSRKRVMVSSTYTSLNP